MNMVRHIAEKFYKKRVSKAHNIVQFPLEVIKIIEQRNHTKRKSRPHFLYVSTFILSVQLVDLIYV